MSGEESNIPIKVDDESFDRIETTRFNSIEEPDGSRTKKDLDLPKKKSTSNSDITKSSLDVELTEATSDSQEKSNSETHAELAPSAPQNPTSRETATLKRKNDHDYEDMIRNSYGYDDISAASMKGQVGVSHLSASKSFRPMRRNSVLIRPERGQGNRFPDVVSDVEAAMHETQRQQQIETMESFDRSTLTVELREWHSHPHRLADSTNASCTEKEGAELANKKEAR